MDIFFASLFFLFETCLRVSLGGPALALQDWGSNTADGQQWVVELLVTSNSSPLPWHIQGAFFWDYSRMGIHGMRIADYLEYYQAKEWVIQKWFHSWKELAWELIRGSEKSQEYRGLMYFAKRTVLWLIPFFGINHFQNDSVHSSFGGGMTRILFHSFWNWNVTQKNASCFSSLHSHSGIVRKECTLN